MHAGTHIHTHTHTHTRADLHLGDTHCSRTCGVYLSSDFLLTPELFIIFIWCYAFFSYRGQLCHQLTALLLWWLTGKEPDCQCRVCKRHRFYPWVRIPLEVEMATSPVFLTGESHGQRSLAGYSPRVEKSHTRLKWLCTHEFLNTFKLWKQLNLLSVVFCSFCLADSESHILSWLQGNLFIYFSSLEYSCWYGKEE